ncbi:MAG: flagellar hook-basal body complex protein FliE [Candidatus Zixiibacteriota bacterium]
MKINPITDRPKIGTLKNDPVGKAQGNAFTDMIDSADGAQKDADKMLTKMVNGEPVEAHDVMLSLRQAESQFHLVLQIRNKMMESYQQVMKTQI